MKVHYQGDAHLIDGELKRSVLLQVQDTFAGDRRVLALGFNVWSESAWAGARTTHCVTLRVRHVRSQLIEVHSRHSALVVATRRALQKARRALNRTYRRRLLSLPTLQAS